MGRLSRNFTSGRRSNSLCGEQGAPMAHWLFKSEPSAWSFAQQVEAGEKGTNWNGVRNHQAKLNMMAMKVGEQAFFYHSNQGKAVVGVVEIIKPYYPDPTDETGVFGMVDIRAVRALPHPVTLEAIKAEKRLAKMALVTNSRLSVQPVADAEWKIIRAMGGA
jgi:predicted RNA-binding protein with PUA-like domain